MIRIRWKVNEAFVPNIGHMVTNEEYTVQEDVANILVEQGKAEYVDLETTEEEDE